MKHATLNNIRNSRRIQHQSKGQQFQIIASHKAFNQSRFRLNPSCIQGQRSFTISLCKANDEGFSQSGDQQDQIENDGVRSPDSQIGEYTVQTVLGRGASGVTYQALAPDGTLVAIKEVVLNKKTPWKVIQLIEREAKVLRNLDHPGIPKYIDYLQHPSPAGSAIQLVQQQAQGKTLGTLVKSGWRPKEAEVLKIARKLLDILVYLNSIRPAVIHRDIKPENVVVEQGPGGEVQDVRLVDFGGVQDAVVLGEGQLGSTVIGTYGYMAPEQFRGAALPQSDCYALGGTVLYLVSGQHPSAFPLKGLTIDLSGRISVSDTMEALLKGLLSADPDARLTAQGALDILDGKVVSVNINSTPRKALAKSSKPIKRPAGARSEIVYEDGTMSITIPPSGITGNSMFTGIFALTWNGIIGTMTASLLLAGSFTASLITLPFWFAGYETAKEFITSSFLKERVFIDARSNSFWVSKQIASVTGGNKPVFKMKPKIVGEGESNDLLGAHVINTVIVNNEPQTAVEIQEGVNKYIVGEGLERLEQEWLAAELNSFLGVDASALDDSSNAKVVVVDQDAYRTPRRNDLGYFNDRNDRFFRDEFDDRW